MNTQPEFVQLTDGNVIFDALCALGGNLFDQSVNRPEILRALAEKFAAHANVLTLRRGEETAALCAWYDNDLATRTAFLSVIVVAGSAQGCGCGSRLLTEVLRRCAEHGMRQMRLEVRKDNRAAIRFYENRGFRQERQQEGSLFYLRSIEGENA